MSESSPPLPRVAVIGGGIAGLAAAHRIAQLAPRAEVRLFEASDRLGGALQTQREGELVFELGADSFLAKDSAVVDLCRELGLGDALIPTRAENRRAMVVSRGRLAPIPSGFVLMQPRQIGSVLRSSILSVPGKMRLCWEPLVRRHPAAGQPTHDESIASFATRRLGREAYERLVEPLMGGIYVGDATKLSLAATMPEFLDAELREGSLVRAARKQAPTPAALANRSEEEAAGARYNAFLTLESGLESLVAALVAALPENAVQRNARVSQLAKTGGRWRLDVDGKDSEEFDGVILATPAAQAAALVGSIDPQLGSMLGRIESASSAVVTLVYRAAQLARPLDSFGFVVPRIEGREILAASFPSVKFPGRGSEDVVPVRVFLGGVLRPEMVDRDDAELVAVAVKELADLLSVTGPPIRSSVARWRQAMPQYKLGHVQLVDAIEHRTVAHPGLALAGNSYRGVGIPQCLASGRRAAEDVAAAILEKSPSTSAS